MVGFGFWVGVSPGGGRTLRVRNLYSKLAGGMIKMARKMQNWKMGSQVAKTGKNYK
jgi:hypothetical protein